jgi:hypothetical protein
MKQPTKPQNRALSKDGPTSAEQRWRPIVEAWRCQRRWSTSRFLVRGRPST